MGFRPLICIFDAWKCVKSAKGKYSNKKKSAEFLITLSLFLRDFKNYYFCPVKNMKRFKNNISRTAILGNLSADSCFCT